jgi:hypothetical protein
MSDLLQAIFTGWGWKIGKPVEVVATNQFGNAIVRNEGGSYFRIMPEEWQCERIATLLRNSKRKEKLRNLPLIGRCHHSSAARRLHTARLPKVRFSTLSSPGFSEANTRRRISAR